MERRGTQEQRAVSFTKRRNGFFNKAAELCMLCGAQIALLVSSPISKKESFYSFGHSSVDAVIYAFLNGTTPNPVQDDVKNSAVSVYKATKALESQPEIWDTDNRKRKRDVEQFWPDLEDLADDCRSIEDIRFAIDRLQELKDKVQVRLDKNRNNQEEISKHHVRSEYAQDDDGVDNPTLDLLQFFSSRPTIDFNSELEEREGRNDDRITAGINIFSESDETEDETAGEGEGEGEGEDEREQSVSHSSATSFHKRKQNPTEESERYTLFRDEVAAGGENSLLVQRITEVFGELQKVKGLTQSEINQASIRLTSNPSYLLLFFSIPSEYRLGWVRNFLSENIMCVD